MEHSIGNFYSEVSTHWLSGNEAIPATYATARLANRLSVHGEIATDITSLIGSTWKPLYGAESPKSGPFR